jgi:hypothetical protein
MPSTERRPRRIDIKLPPSGGGSTADTATTEPVPPSIPAPAAPSGLTVTSTALLYSAVSPQALANLSWYAPPGLTPDAYVIQWGLDSGFTSPTTRPTSGAATTAGVDGLPVGTAVYFRVAAVVRGVSGAWSNTASATMPSDTTPPAAPTSFSYIWNGLTGDLNITWTNPTSANFRDVRVRIYASNGGALYREEYSAAGAYTWTLAKQYTDTSGAYDPNVYVVLTSRSWGGVFSATDLTGSPGLTPPATPAGLTTSWAGDTGTAAADLLITWTRSNAVADYELTITGLGAVARRVGHTDRYLYTFDQNAAENGGAADPSLTIALKAVDALGQTSVVAASTTATNAAPPAMSAPTVFSGTSTIGLTITASTAKDLKDYEVKVYLNGGGVAVDTVYVTTVRPTITIEDGSGSYQFTVAARDLFNQVGTTSSLTTAVDLIDWDTFIDNLRSGLLYTDSVGTAFATLSGLKDGNLATNVVTYTASTPYRSTTGDWQQTVTHQTSELVITVSIQVYMATSTDGTTWTFYYGGTPSGGVWTAASSTATEATAAAGAVILTPGAWRIDLPAPAQARYIRIYHRNTTLSYSFREFFPSTLIRGTYVQAESITAYHIAAGAITGDRLTATAINGFTITGATIQTAASGERVVLDSTGLKTYDSAGVVQVEATTATDGKLTAGAGDVKLDATGILVREAGANLTSPKNAYNIGPSTGTPSAQFFCTVSPDTQIASTYIYGRPVDAAGGTIHYNTDVYVVAEANGAESASPRVILRADHGDIDPGEIILEADPWLATISAHAAIVGGLNVGYSSAGVNAGYIRASGGLNLGSATGAGAGDIHLSDSIESTSFPAGLLDSAGTGPAAQSLRWRSNAAGYAANVVNSSSTAGANGLFVETVNGSSRLLTLRQGGTDRFVVSVSGIAFFGAAGNTKQTVTGSRGGNAALASLLTALASYGLITDSSS